MYAVRRLLPTVFVEVAFVLIRDVFTLPEALPAEPPDFGPDFLCDTIGSHNRSVPSDQQCRMRQAVEQEFVQACALLQRLLRLFALPFASSQAFCPQDDAPQPDQPQQRVGQRQRQQASAPNGLQGRHGDGHADAAPDLPHPVALRAVAFQTALLDKQRAHQAHVPSAVQFFS